MIVPGIVDSRRQAAAPPATALWKWRTDVSPAGIVFSEGDTRITNVSAGNALVHSCPVDGRLNNTFGTEQDFWIYFELHFTPSYSGATRYYTGQIGFYARLQGSTSPSYWAGFPSNINSFWSLNWYGLTGRVRFGTTTRITNNGLRFGDKSVPPIVARILIHPKNGQFYFAGESGDFKNADGSSAGFNPLNSETNTPLQRSNNNSFFSVMPRDEGDSYKIVSGGGELAYAIPDQSVALGTLTPFSLVD